jgi:hypothetical protein
MDGVAVRLSIVIGQDTSGPHGDIEVSGSDTQRLRDGLFQFHAASVSARCACQGTFPNTGPARTIPA